MTSPLFIVGANRSGTTLLRLILNAHSRLAIPEELVYFDTHLPFNADLRHWRTPPFSREQYRRYVRWFLESNPEAFLPLQVDDLQARILDKSDDDFAVDLRRPYQKALETWASYYGKARWGEKTPGNLFFVDVILDMFPEAQFIYVVRDPRAGVHSMANTDLFSGDVAINALNRHKYDTQGRRLLEQVVPPAQRTTVRYEDLVRQPEETVSTLCDFLAEPFEPAMLSFHRDAEKYMKPGAARTFNSAATRPIDDSKIDAWRGTLAPAQVAVIESICAGPMERFGYAPEAYSPRLTDRVDTLVKRAYYRLQCWRYRDKPQYTLKDPIFARSRRRLRTAFQKPVVWASRVRDVLTGA